jgi:hypothetical protein
VSSSKFTGPNSRFLIDTVQHVLLRCTARMLDVLGAKSVVLVDDPPGDDDWYANLLWLDRRKCVLLTHAGTLFPVFLADVRKRDLQPPGPFVATHVSTALTDEKLPTDLLGSLDPDASRIARTASRSVLGFMNDSAPACRYAVEDAGGLEHTDLDALNRFLRRQLHNRDGYRQPLDLAMDRLVS